MTEQQRKENKSWGEREARRIFILVAMIVLVGGGLLVLSCDPAEAHPHENWKCITTATVVDIDPWGEGNAIFVEFDNGYWMGAAKWEGTRPGRGNYGTLYERKRRGSGTTFKWVKSEKPKPKLKAVPKFTLQWKFVLSELPAFDKTVLVKYKNDVTITTAYLTSTGQWKLEINRNSEEGGETIDTIKEWAEIPK